jgi:hypothetical protein
MGRAEVLEPTPEVNSVNCFNQRERWLIDWESENVFYPHIAFSGGENDFLDGFSDLPRTFYVAIWSSFHLGERGEFQPTIRCFGSTRVGSWESALTSPCDRWHQKGRRGIVVDRRSLANENDPMKKCSMPQAGIDQRFVPFRAWPAGMNR